MNKLFVIEGTDGSGKQTQTTELYNRLLQDGKIVFRTSFPNYESRSSELVKMYLAGEISQNPNDVSAKAASLFYAVDRYITYKKELQPYYTDEKTIILLDRYVSSNLLHQGGKLLKGEDYSKIDDFALWLSNLEYGDLELPIASQTFFLYLPIEHSLKAIENRENKITHEEKKDIHESDPNHLMNANKSGYYLATKLGWNIIDCLNEKGQRKTVQEIHEEIYKIVKKELKSEE